MSNNTKANIHHKVHTGLRIYHYHTDHLGTPQELTNDRGDVVWLNYSLAWGGSFDKLNNVDNLDGLDVSADELQPIRFQGQFFDRETNLHYNRFRYYDSDVGMFVSRDPIELLGGNNTFQYAPNPIEWIDPLGLISCPSVKQIDFAKIVKKFGGKHIVADYYEFATKKAAKQAAVEIAGNLGGDREITRKKNFKGGPKSWKKGQNRIGATSKKDDMDNSCSGWRDDSPGHEFYKKENGKKVLDTLIPSHFNAWNIGGGVDNIHLLYSKGLILDKVKYT